MDATLTTDGSDVVMASAGCRVRYRVSQADRLILVLQDAGVDTQQIKGN